MKYSESELKVLDVLWEYGKMDAKKIAAILEEKSGWSRTTVYTLIKRCMDKGLIQRDKPYVCKAILTKEEAQKMEMNEMMGKFFGNSPTEFLNAFVLNGDFSEQDISEMQEIIDRLKVK